jgi:opacity protein-like surface antigen
MNKIALSVAALLAAGPALAGGFSPVVVPSAPAAPTAVIPPVVASADWSGPYVGGQLGYGRLSADDNDDTTDLLLEEDSYNGAIYGLHAGYRFDFGRIVAGAELDFDGASIEVDDADINADLGTEFTDALDVGSVRRAKLQLGFDAGNILPYVTAGIAQVHLNSDDSTLEDAVGDTAEGNFVGLGASYMVSDRLMVGVEALRHNFDEFDSGSALEGGDIDVNTVSLRGSFRF